MRRDSRIKTGKAAQALEPLRQAMRHSLDSYKQNVGAGLAIRHTHGSQHIGKLYQDTLRFLGI